MNHSPTPSQKAFNLKKLLASRDIDLTLSVVQELVAQIEGFESWNHFVKIVPSRGINALPSAVSTEVEHCKRCGFRLAGLYCLKEDCLYSDWPQVVPEESFAHGDPSGRMLFLDGLSKRDRGDNLVYSVDGQLTVRALLHGANDFAVRNKKLEVDLEQWRRRLEKAIIETGLLAEYQQRPEGIFLEKNSAQSSFSSYGNGCPEIQLHYQKEESVGSWMDVEFALKYGTWRIRATLKRPRLRASLGLGRYDLISPWECLYEETLVPSNEVLAFTLQRVLQRAEQEKARLLNATIKEA